MSSTFSGIYAAQNSLSLNQATIAITSNNIANVSTEGYSKQRAELATMVPYGACIEDITRNRDAFLDSYYRSENSDFCYYEELAENASLIENMTNELDNIGINNSMEEFYQALSQLSTDSDDYVLRNTVVQKAKEFCTKLNSLYDQLKSTRETLVGDFTQPSSLENSKVNIISNDLNDKLSSIASLNSSIILANAQGGAPNHLLDERDKLLDEVSESIPISIINETNGAATVSLGNTILVSGKEQMGFFEVIAGDIDNPAVVQIENENGATMVLDASSIITSGKLGAILEMGGSAANTLTIKSVMDNLDTLAYQFATTFNNIQTAGQYMTETVAGSGVYELSGDPAVTVPPYFFVDDAAAGTIPAGATGFAALISVNNDIVNDPYQIAAANALSTAEETGDGANALLMSQMREGSIAALGGATPEQYIINVVSDIGSKTSIIKTNYDIKESINEQISQKRESVSGVSLDEEMTDLIRFQRAYEAAARVFNVVNQNIQTILGLVG